MSKSTFVLDDEREEELEKLKEKEGKSKSKIVREVIGERYLKEKRAEENLDFFIDLYREGVVTRDLLALLLPEEDAKAVIIGSKRGKEASEIAKELGG